ncbi:hypothetical protein ACN4EK_12425 [Pantanalinema rosaneae CENA516]|uniref:hypothetical protein n=1 Tax=Pantanalinema rosaneae TaxID=1620701 RepID=UPI003D6F46AE
MAFRGSRNGRSKRMMAVGSVLLAFGLLTDLQTRSQLSGNRKPIGDSCQKVIHAEATLSKHQLARLLAIPEGGNKQQVREITKAPYCELGELQIRVGATAQREAYPLEFDPQTWLVLLYEGDQYAGYRFSGQ